MSAARVVCSYLVFAPNATEHQEENRVKILVRRECKSKPVLVGKELGTNGYLVCRSCKIGADFNEVFDIALKHLSSQFPNLSDDVPSPVAVPNMELPAIWSAISQLMRAISLLQLSSLFNLQVTINSR